MSTHQQRRGFRDSRLTIAMTLLLVATATVTLGWAAATPSTTIPVGISLAEGPSMGDEVNSDLVLHANLGYENVDVGTEIVYYNTLHEEFVYHRVVEKTPKWYVTKGDANNGPDAAPVTRENYVGEVLIRLPMEGAV